MRSHISPALVLVLFFCAPRHGQTQQSPQPSAPQPASPSKPKPAADPSSARLASAKTIWITSISGSAIPYDVIKSTIEDWGRFIPAESAKKADLIVEIATSGGEGGVRFSSSDSTSPLTGHPERSSSTSRDFSNSEITMIVYDTNRRLLWKGTQIAKYAMKETTRKNNLVEAAEHLASKFHDRLEPPALPAKD